jgi:DNA polymerase III psi subunit
MSQSITINLSDELYSLLQRAAELAEQPVEVIVAQSLAHSLPPLLEDIPAAYQLDVYPLLTMTDAELMQELNRTFPSNGWIEYEDLLEEKKSRILTEQETKRLEKLRHEADVLALRKSYAAVLLKRRGQPVPALDKLPNTS